MDSHGSIAGGVASVRVVPGTVPTLVERSRLSCLHPEAHNTLSPASVHM